MSQVETKFDKSFEEWADANKKLYQDCKEYIGDVLNKVPNNAIELDCENMPCVTYDGGNHPEYDANPYSMVNCVYLNNGNIYLDTEDTSVYSIDNINAEELYYVACAVRETLEYNFDLED